MNDFYSTQDWKLLKQKVLHCHGLRCMKCGKTPKHNVLITVDHIKPRATHKKLELKKSNMQVLCQPCNSAKGLTVIDYRGDGKVMILLRMVIFLAVTPFLYVWIFGCPVEIYQCTVNDNRALFVMMLAGFALLAFGRR